MGKKKKVEEKMVIPVDPKIVELKSIITDHQNVINREIAEEKELWHPLRRVNSHPIIYEYVPMSRNLFLGSLSIDHGFNENFLNIPNLVFYKEELPEDILGIEPLGDLHKTQLTSSLSFIMSGEIDSHDMEKLEELKKHDSQHFLTNRIGAKHMEKLQKHMKNPLTALPEVQQRIEERRQRTRRRRFIWLFLLVILVLLVSSITTLYFAGVPLLFFSLSENATNEIVDLPTTSPSVVTESDIVASEPDEIVDLSEGEDAGEILGINTGIMMDIYCDIKSLNGAPVSDYMGYFNTSSIISKMLTEVFEYLGYEIDEIIVFDLKLLPSNNWRVRVAVFAKAHNNLGIMMWYGYKIKEDVNSDSEFIKSLNGHLKQIANKLQNTNMDIARSAELKQFKRDAKNYSGQISITRPPRHIPDDWGSCTGSPLCP